MGSGGGSFPRARDWPLSPGQQPPPGARAIKLTQRVVAWVDDEDNDSIAQWPWFAHLARTCEAWYAKRNRPLGGRKQASELMHRVIMNAPLGTDVDHREHHFLARVVDNRKSNLRLCTRQENCRNQRKPRGQRASIYKGVTFHKKWRGGSWIARVALGNGQYDRLGRFDSEVHAAMAYDYSVRKHFGEFARTNFPACEGPTWGAPDA